MKRQIKRFLLNLASYIVSQEWVDINVIHSRILTRIEENEGVFFTGHKRPKHSKDYNSKSIFTELNCKTAIVLQGPILKEFNFTFETIKIYLKNYTDTHIIVSTWDDEDKDEIKKIQALGVHLLLNKKPDFPGISHINYQITSSSAGIKTAKDLGASYVLKSRTDQRICNPGAINFFLNLVELFPLKIQTIQQKRLIVPSINTFLYRMYGVTDMMMFGHIDDMSLYWNAKNDNRNFGNEAYKKMTLRQFANMNACEIYLCTEFLKRIGRKILWTIEDSWGAFIDHFCVVDSASIDLYWPKYQRGLEYRNQYYLYSHTHQLLKFSDWLGMFIGNKSKYPINVLDYYEAEVID